MVTKTRAEKKQNKKGGHAKKSGHSLLLTDLIIRGKIKEAAKKRMKMGRFNRPAKQMANDST